jgi:hypothetical protein
MMRRIGQVQRGQQGLHPATHPRLMVTPWVILLPNL